MSLTTQENASYTPAGYKEQVRIPCHGGHAVIGM